MVHDLIQVVNTKAQDWDWQYAKGLWSVMAVKSALNPRWVLGLCFGSLYRMEREERKKRGRNNRGAK